MAGGAEGSFSWRHTADTADTADVWMARTRAAGSLIWEAAAGPAAPGKGRGRKVAACTRGGSRKV
eukprot:1160213-Pelagomonas_calceolata.AAC.7